MSASSPAIVGETVRTVLITGAARGIGAAVATTVAAPGVALILHARSESPELLAVAQQCRTQGAQCTLALGDLADPQTAVRLRDTALAQHGRLDALVANAGFADRKRIGELSEADWSRSLEALLSGFFRLVTACREPLMASGQGRVVAVSSFVAHVYRLGESGFPASAAAKAGIEALVKSLAVQLAPAGVTVNAVAPGYVQKSDPAKSAIDPAAWQAALARIPMQRLGQPQEIANVIGFLLAAAASYVTGQVWHVDGGLTL
ncbi:SDR family oxidoreductase [Herbaspirillum sp. AP02]|uniref:SDR family NAD(P)-dependent oxidoreductase n=1 Tax=unclassified Herbaspirillum TaxID=2624150 RepID=UPI0015D99E54|nr:MULTISPECIES: SDR family NAD(P)-dependent oxidoreductase [unclassified Herbaspirillum]MBG7622366.1 SDR family oxidoreductase [Herbaspirillum sp. AP02]NZD70231.1 SDR family oxidoreductase [Herbaspirillum sp. AP21]